jgi:hypothetical protein
VTGSYSVVGFAGVGIYRSRVIEGAAVTATTAIKVIITNARFVCSIYVSQSGEKIKILMTGDGLGPGF